MKTVAVKFIYHVEIQVEDFATESEIKEKAWQSHENDLDTGTANPDVEIVKEKKETCPSCGEEKKLDALSRKDNETMICDECGTKEAMEDFLNHMPKKG